MFIQKYLGGSVMEMGCCGCFGISFAKKHKKDLRPRVEGGNHVLQGLLLNEEVADNEEDEEDNRSYCDDATDTDKGDAENGDTDKEDHEEFMNPAKSSQEILIYRTENGLICREFPIKETNRFIRSEVMLKLHRLSTFFCAGFFLFSVLAHVDTLL